jgi:hypothetical protein
MKATSACANCDMLWGTTMSAHDGDENAVIMKTTDKTAKINLFIANFLSETLNLASTRNYIIV